MKDTNDQAGVSANLAIPQSLEQVGENDVHVTSIDLQGIFFKRPSIYDNGYVFRYVVS
ncbi:hypothetical protein Hanom_Chr02g00098181 [Helianthus anomalus]